MRLPLPWRKRDDQADAAPYALSEADAAAILAGLDKSTPEAAQQRLLDLAARTTAPGTALGPDAPMLGVPAPGLVQDDERDVRRNRGRW